MNMSELEELIEARVSELTRSSEAGIALVTVAVIDEWLQKLLLTAMRPLSNSIAKRIFGNGALSDVAPKADVAYAFTLIDESILTRLRILNAVRNIFAHTTDPLDFTSPEIVDACRGFPGWENGIDSKKLFDETAIACVKAIDAKTHQIVFEQSVENKPVSR
jgi:hypothetical protein